jgi:hypothetical protein
MISALTRKESRGSFVVSFRALAYEQHDRHPRIHEPDHRSRTCCSLPEDSRDESDEFDWEADQDVPDFASRLSGQGSGLPYTLAQ